MANTATHVRQYQVPTQALIAFFTLTFVLTWGLVGLYIVAPEWASDSFGEFTGAHPFFFLATWSPAISAFGIVLYYGGPSGLKRFLSRVILWRASHLWAAFILIGIPITFIFGSMLKGGTALAPIPEEGLSSLVILLFIMLFLGPVEEFGWRGVAQPVLQRKVAPFWAGVIIGVFWGVWHLPAFFLSGTVFAGWDFFPFLVGSVALSILVTPIMNSSRGSLLWPMVFHWQLINPFWPDAQPYDTWLFLALAAAVVWWNRGTMLKREDRVVDVIPVA